MTAAAAGLVAALMLAVVVAGAAEPVASPPGTPVHPGASADTTPAESPEAASRRLVVTALRTGTITDESPLVNAQSTADEPDWDIQLLFLDKGTPEQRARMTGQLRRWFTDDVREAPARDPGRTLGDDDCRATAAEMLAEYGDRASASSIRRWLDRGSIDAAPRERAARALARLDSPCQGRWLTAEGNREVALCPGAGLITVKACWTINGRADCGEPVPIESARYLARTIRLQSVRRVHAPVASTLSLMVTGKSDFEVRIFPADDARSIYLVERDMLGSGLAWRADSPELARWVIGWLKTAPPANALTGR
jgi:hypothetical protein